MAERVGPLSVLLDRPCVACGVRLRDHTAEQTAACCERVEGWLRPSDDAVAEPVASCVCGSRGSDGPAEDCPVHGDPRSADGPGDGRKRSTSTLETLVRIAAECIPLELENGDLCSCEPSSMEQPGYKCWAHSWMERYEATGAADDAGHAPADFVCVCGHRASDHYYGHGACDDCRCKGARVPLVTRSAHDAGAGLVLNACKDGDHSWCAGSPCECSCHGPGDAKGIGGSTPPRVEGARDDQQGSWYGGVAPPQPSSPADDVVPDPHKDAFAEGWRIFQAERYQPGDWALRKAFTHIWDAARASGGSAGTEAQLVADVRWLCDELYKHTDVADHLERIALIREQLEVLGLATDADGDATYGGTNQGPIYGTGQQNNPPTGGTAATSQVDGA